MNTWTKDDPRFEEACQNLAAFIWNGWQHYHYSDKKALWEATPKSTKEQIRAFILAPKENPKRKA